MEARGGKCIAIQCDHSKDEDIERVFEKIQSEENGCLDILVNNAYSGVKVRRDRRRERIKQKQKDDINVQTETNSSGGFKISKTGGYKTKFPENCMKMRKTIWSIKPS